MNDKEKSNKLYLWMSPESDSQTNEQLANRSCMHRIAFVYIILHFTTHYLALNGVISYSAFLLIDSHLISLIAVYHVRTIVF